MIGLVTGGVAGVLAQWFVKSSNPLQQQVENFANLINRNEHPLVDRLKTFSDVVVTPVGDIFLAMIFMIVVPLLLSALILGVAQIGDIAKVGRLGIRVLALTVLFSGIAVGLAFAGVNTIKPGTHISAEKRDELFKAYEDEGIKKAEVKEPEKVTDPAVIGLVPKNPLLEASRALSGGLLPFMFFALVFGVAMAKVDPEKSAPLVQFFEGLFEVSQKVIEMAMNFAPIGVFALVFKTAAALGLDIFITLGVYAALVLVLLAIHMFVVYSILLKVLAGRNPIQFFRQMKTVMLTAFSTSSSNATLPVALTAAHEEVGVPRDISSFVLTIGATANQNGTALFEGVTIIFFCQLFNVPLGPAEQLSVLMVAILAGIGTAGVPGGAWPVIGSIVKTLGVPAGAIGMALGIDRILDMSRTVLNVTGDMAIACCLAKWEGRTGVIPEEALE